MPCDNTLSIIVCKSFQPFEDRNKNNLNICDVRMSAVCSHSTLYLAISTLLSLIWLPTSIWRLYSFTVTVEDEECKTATGVQTFVWLILHWDDYYSISSFTWLSMSHTRPKHRTSNLFRSYSTITCSPLWFLTATSIYVSSPSCITYVSAKYSNDIFQRTFNSPSTCRFIL